MLRARFAYEIIDPSRLTAEGLWKVALAESPSEWEAARIWVRSSQGPGGSVVAEILHRPASGRTAYACGTKVAWASRRDIEEAVSKYVGFVTGEPIICCGPVSRLPN